VSLNVCGFLKINNGAWRSVNGVVRNIDGIVKSVMGPLRNIPRTFKSTSTELL
jgi:hypothetical protein